MTRVVVQKAFAANGVTPTVSRVLGSREPIKEPVAEGMGLGAIFENEVGPDPRLGTVTIETAPVSQGVYAVCLKKALDMPAVRASSTASLRGEQRLAVSHGQWPHAGTCAGLTARGEGVHGVSQRMRTLTDTGPSARPS